MTDSTSDELLGVLLSFSHRSCSSSVTHSSTCPLCNLSVQDEYALWQHVCTESIYNLLTVAASPILISYFYMVVAFVLIVVLLMPDAGTSTVGLKDLFFHVVGQP